MKRVFAEDGLVCSRSGGKMRLVAVSEDPAVIEKILRHLGPWSRGPPRERRVVLERTALTGRPAASVLLEPHGIPLHGLHLNVSRRTVDTGEACGI